MANFYLKFLYPGRNNIEKVNGIAFANLPQLVIINLEYNECINKLFEIERGSNNFRRKISRKCASADFKKQQLSCITSMACDLIYPNWNSEIFSSDNPSICCELELGTVIDAYDYTFVADTKYTPVKRLFINHQQNVEYLPVSVHERFPVLETYEVVNTPVQKISKRNFEKLFMLKYLKLDRNEIEVIRSNTFEDLISLEMIDICKYGNTL